MGSIPWPRVTEVAMLHLISAALLVGSMIAPASEAPPVMDRWQPRSAAEECLVASAIVPMDAQIQDDTEATVATSYALQTLQFELLETYPDALSAVTTTVSDIGLTTGLTVLAADSVPTDELVARSVQDLSPGAQQWLDVSDVQVEVTDAPAFARLCGAMNLTVDLMPSGLGIESVTIDLRGGATHVLATGDPRDELRRALSDFADVVVVERSPYSPSVGASRVNDTDGYNAGGGATVGGSACSSAFRMVNGGQPFLLGAAHCGLNGATVTNGNAYCTGNSYATIGSFGSSLAASNYDFAAIWPSSTVTAYTWRGPGCNSGSAYQTGNQGTSTPAYGAAVLFSGSRSGAQTGSVASHDAGCILHNGGLPSEFTACAAYRAIAYPSLLCQRSDSGGPAYTLTAGNRVLATGSISGTFTMAGDGVEYNGCNYSSVNTALYLYGAYISTAPL